MDLEAITNAVIAAAPAIAAAVQRKEFTYDDDSSSSASKRSSPYRPTLLQFYGYGDSAATNIVCQALGISLPARFVTGADLQPGNEKRARLLARPPRERIGVI